MELNFKCDKSGKEIIIICYTVSSSLREKEGYMYTLEFLNLGKACVTILVMN